MTIFDSIILGLVQGLTEFIPVSSTGHLIIFRDLLKLPLASGLAFDAILQLATALAVIVYFWSTIWQLIKSFFNWISGRVTNASDKTFILAVIIGTIPAILFGLLLENYMETVFRNIIFVAVGLILGSILFLWVEHRTKQNKILTVSKGFLAGLFQCLALFPGMSRSGSTIAGGLFLGLSREDAVKLSFFLSLPVILGSGLKKLLDLYQTGQLATVESSLIIASVVAFISGLVAISFLVKYLKKNTLNVFAYYRLGLAAIIIVFWFIR